MRTLTVSLDQGSIGWAATWFLAYYMKMPVVPLPDPHHRMWNDVRLSLQDAQLWDTVMLLTCCFNSPFGPWNGGAWHEEAAEAFALFHQQAGPADPLFLHMLPRILQDLGQQDRILEEGIEKTIWDLLLESPVWRQRPPKVALARWFSWMDSAAWHLPVWHTKVLGLVYMGVKANWSDLKDALASLKPLPAASSKGEPARTNTTGKNSEMANIRRLAKKTPSICVPQC